MRRRAAAAVVAAGLLLPACTSSATRTTTSPPVTPPASSSSAPTTATSSSTSSAPTAAARTATVLGSGDVLIHPPVWEQAHRDAGGDGYDFGPMYASIAPDVQSADLATCELETPLAPPTGPFVGYPDFDAPPQVLTALKGVGYDSCTTASNHSLDQGATGVRRTLDELDEAGLRHTGSARSQREADTPLIITLPNGVRIAQLAYAFGFNGIPLPAGTPWLANEIDVPTILAAAHRVKQGGADIVVVSMHWGVEYDHLATALQKSQASALLASPDVDLILGDHAHVVQPAARVHGKWVFYGMGDQVSRHADPIAVTRQGVMPRVTFTETAPGRFTATRVEAVPTWMRDDPLRLIDLARADLGEPDYAAAHRAIVGYLDAYRAVKDGLLIR